MVPLSTVSSHIIENIPLLAIQSFSLRPVHRAPKDTRLFKQFSCNIDYSEGRKFDNISPNKGQQYHLQHTKNPRKKVTIGVWPCRFGLVSSKAFVI